jgi:hypothetical protein
LFRSTLDALRRIRYGLEAGLRDIPSAGLASAITSIVDPCNRRFNFVEGVPLAAQETQSEFLFGIVAPNLCHVGRYADGLAVVLQGIIFHLGHVAQNSRPHSQESFPMKRQVGSRHFRGRHLAEPLQSAVVQEFRPPVVAGDVRHRQFQNQYQ